MYGNNPRVTYKWIMSAVSLVRIAPSFVPNPEMLRVVENGKGFFDFFKFFTLHLLMKSENKRTITSTYHFVKKTLYITNIFLRLYNVYK